LAGFLEDIAREYQILYENQKNNSEKRNEKYGKVDKKNKIFQ